LSRVRAKEGEPKVTEREGKVLVEKVAQKLAHAVVGPATVDEQQPFQVPKLRNAVVRRQHCLENHLSFVYAHQTRE